jgi:hypothetical protein
MKNGILIFLMIPLMFFLSECGNKKGSAKFVEKSRIEISQNADQTWNFKNVGGSSSGLILTMSLNGGNMSVDGFYAGTLLVVGETGITMESSFDRDGYTVECKYNFPKATTIEVRNEGKISPNLEFVRDGDIVTDFTVRDSTNKTVVTNRREIVFSNGKVKDVFFLDERKPKKIKSATGKTIDLKNIVFGMK